MRILTALWLVSLVSGCTSMYVAKLDEEPHGYFESKLDDQRYQVHYQTYKSITQAEMFDFVIKRSAQLAFANGYSYFTLSDKQNESVIELIQMPEIMGSATQINTYTVSTQSHIAAPGYTMEMNIKTASAVAHFTHEASMSGVYSVEHLIND